MTILRQREKIPKGGKMIRIIHVKSEEDVAFKRAKFQGGGDLLNVFSPHIWNPVFICEHFFQ
jgi:hypothetical protein